MVLLFVKDHSEHTTPNADFPKELHYHAPFCPVNLTLTHLLPKVQRPGYF